MRPIHCLQIFTWSICTSLYAKLADYLENNQQVSTFKETKCCIRSKLSVQVYTTKPPLCSVNRIHGSWMCKETFTHEYGTHSGIRVTLSTANINKQDTTDFARNLVAAVVARTLRNTSSTASSSWCSGVSMLPSLISMVTESWQPQKCSVKKCKES